MFCSAASRISIHAPRVGSDLKVQEFEPPTKDFNPRSPCGERPFGEIPNDIRRNISIHAPRVGSDKRRHPGPNAEADFNPRSPCGERQVDHRPHAGNRHFNPRSPCGERRELAQHLINRRDISIHAPRVGSDIVDANGRVKSGYISIHAPRVGSDHQPGKLPVTAADFNPRSPCGERQLAANTDYYVAAFQSVDIQLM